jgi:hypothetical protein
MKKTVKQRSKPEKQRTLRRTTIVWEDILKWKLQKMLVDVSWYPGLNTGG